MTQKRLLVNLFPRARWVPVNQKNASVNSPAPANGGLWLMRHCREQARSPARMGSHQPLDARASHLEYAETIGRNKNNRGEDLPLQTIHLRSVPPSTPQSGPARVASQNYRSSPIPNPLLGLRPSIITSGEPRVVP